jgi:hypothetical protein
MRRTLALTCTLTLLGLTAAALADDPSKPPAGFTALFNGKDLSGWTVLNGKMEKWRAENGEIVTSGGGGWLMTEKEYKDFEIRLEYKLPKAGNSGVAVHSPLKGDPAYTGMEIQILDDNDPSYKNLRPAQYTGSVYGVVAAKRGSTKPAGEWNTMRIVSKGRHITVELNGTVITDANLDEYTKEHGKQHPGLLRETGHLGLQDHSGSVEFRKISVKEL